MRDPQKQNNITTFGADSLANFLKMTGMSMMIRSHSIIPTGIERFSDSLMSLTSATNIWGVNENDACFLVVQKGMKISTKIIKSQPGSKIYWQDINTSTIQSSANSSVQREHTPPRKRQNTQWLN